MATDETQRAEQEEEDAFTSKVLAVPVPHLRKASSSRGKAVLDESPSLKKAFILSVIFRPIGEDL